MKKEQEQQQLATPFSSQTKQREAGAGGASVEEDGEKEDGEENNATMTTMGRRQWRRRRKELSGKAKSRSAIAAVAAELGSKACFLELAALLLDPDAAAAAPVAMKVDKRRKRVFFDPERLGKF